MFRSPRPSASGSGPSQRRHDIRTRSQRIHRSPRHRCRLARRQGLPPHSSRPQRAALPAAPDRVIPQEHSQSGTPPGSPANPPSFRQLPPAVSLSFKFSKLQVRCRVRAIVTQFILHQVWLNAAAIRHSIYLQTLNGAYDDLFHECALPWSPQLCFLLLASPLY